jgi:hypothetical protein
LEKDVEVKMKIKKGTPPERGMYVAYVDTPLPDSKFLQKKLLMWMDDDEWWYPGSDQKYRGQIYCWIGPLPTPNKESINASVKYMIGTEEGATKTMYLAGPFDTVKDARKSSGSYKEFIFQVKGDGIPKKVAKWNTTKARWMLKKKQKHL